MALMYFYKRDFAMTGKKNDRSDFQQVSLVSFLFFPGKEKKDSGVQPFLKCTTLVVRIFEIKINPNIQPMVYVQTLIHMLYWKIEPGLKPRVENYDDVFEKWSQLRGFAPQRRKLTLMSIFHPIKIDAAKICDFSVYREKVDYTRKNF
jgi:hypothetical protein